MIMYHTFAAYLLFVSMTIPVQLLHAQKKWSGWYGNKWDNALNWQPAGIPAAVDDIVLDNSLMATGYVVVLPDTAVTVHAIAVSPASGKTVQLLLPVTNTASPALTVAANGDAIVIESGGSFTNASGLNSGTSIRMNGLMRIGNNGRYVHHTRSTHAADIVAKLSTATGSENGIFEFDVPGGSYPLSLSNRTYGTLVLSASASGGTQTYNASGTSPLQINGNLQINAGVTVNIDFTKDIVVNGNFIQKGGICNLASQPTSNVLLIKGDIDQDAAGTITETSTGLPVIELAGTINQRLSIAGKFMNQVTLRLNNTNGATLAGNLTLPYKLALVNGKLKTAALNLLVLADGCVASGGSAHAFIDGPVKKTGDDDFEFPIGKQGDYAPVAIIGAGGFVTDAFQAEYFLSNPQAAYGTSIEKPPIIRVSALEYWKAERLAGTSSKKLMVYVGTYSEATAMDKLTIARWDAGTATWKDEGNTAYTGTASGNLTSNNLQEFGIFTIASTEETQNPLPATLTGFSAIPGHEAIQVSWQTAAGYAPSHFILETSLDGMQYAVWRTLPFVPGTTRYQYTYPCLPAHPPWLRLQVVEKNGNSYYSQNILLKNQQPVGNRLHLLPGLVVNDAVLTMSVAVDETVQVIITDLYGIMVTTVQQQPQGNAITLHLGRLPCGVYTLTVVSRKLGRQVIRFVKV